jgi:hypothetical protein
MVRVRDDESNSTELIQMSFGGENKTPEQVEKPARRGRNKKENRQVDGRQLESFKTLAELLKLPVEQSLNLDIDAAIKMMEADLERLKRLKNAE